MRTVARSAFALLLTAACASSSVGTANIHPHSVGMSLAEAQEVAASFEKDLAKRDQADPLRHPHSLDDVMEILHRDQIDLFPGGVEYASSLGTPEAKVLEAQIELAWGDAQLTLADLFSELAAIKSVQLRRLESAGELPADQATERDRLRTTVSRETNIAEAMSRLAAEHVAAGAAIARGIISASPNDYQGYRLAADYYRMRGDWPKFNEMVEKIQATNPQSNGLLFLKAMAAIQQQGKTDDGQNLLKQALEKDPKFARCQAELVLTARSIEKKNEQLQVLRALNANHQVVVWVGPHIELAYLKAQ